MPNHRLTLGLLLCLAAARSASAETATSLDEVVVDAPRAGDPAKGPIDGYVARESATGTKTSTPLIETPQSIAVVGATEIHDIGAQSVDDAVRYVSGVRGDTFGNDTRNDWFLIRGFPGQVSGYFLDGLQLYSNAFATFRVEPFGLERLEILKGPASVLYGGSNVGGIINAVSKRPPSTAQGYVETGVNNYGNAYAAFDLGGPVSPKPDNSFYYRVVGVTRAGGTQTDFTDDDRVFVAPSLAWAPDDDTKITLLGSYQRDRTNGQNFLPYVGTVVPAPYGKIPTSLFTSEPGYDSFKRNQALIGYEFEHRLNETFTVRQNMRFSHLEIDFRTLYGGGYVGGDAASAELARFNFITTPVVNEVALDNQIEGRFRTGPLSHVALLGLDYKHYTLDDNQGFAFGTPLNLLQPVYTGATAPATRYILNGETQDQLGVYAQDQAKLGPWTLVLSGRHDSLSTDLVNKLTTPATRTDATDGAFTGRAGLIYTTGFGLAPYATLATSFDPQLGTNGATGQALVPTTGVLKEVGAKYDALSGRLALTGALFDLTQNNVLTTDPTNLQSTIQTGQERSRGFELQAQGDLAHGLKVLASYTGYQLRDTRDLNPTLVGKVPANVPQNFGSLLLDYTLQDGPLRGLGFGAGPRFVGASYAAADDSAGVPSYLLADATVHYDREHWHASVTVANLTDETYVASCQTTSACFYGQRRTILGRLGYSW